MALGNTANQLERAEGVEAEAPKFTGNLCVVLGYGFGNGLGVALLLSAIGVEEEYGLPIRKILLGKIQNSLMELGVVNAGCEAYHVEACQVGGLDLGGINGSHIMLCGDGVDQLPGVSMVLGIVNDCGFHRHFPLHFYGTKIILCMRNPRKYAEFLYMVRIFVPEGTMKKEMTPEEYLQRVLTTQVSDRCPMRRTLEMLNGKWRTHIIYELCKHGTRRFGELKKAVPHITNTMLSSTLKDLEGLEIIHREQFNEIPPHVEYSLTEKGKALLPVFTELAKWGEKYIREESV